MTEKTKELEEKLSKMQNELLKRDAMIAEMAIRLSSIECVLLKKNIVKDSDLQDSLTESVDKFKKAAEDAMSKINN